jgi:hypothetical protein
MVLSTEFGVHLEVFASKWGRCSAIYLNPFHAANKISHSQNLTISAMNTYLSLVISLKKLNFHLLSAETISVFRSTKIII